MQLAERRSTRTKRGRSGLIGERGKFIITALLFIITMPASAFIMSVSCLITPDPISGIGLFSILTFVLWGAACAVILRVVYRRGGFLFSLCTSLMASAGAVIFRLLICHDVSVSFLMDLLCYTMTLVSLTTLPELCRKKNDEGHRRYR